MQIETKKSIWQNYQKLCMVFLFVMGSFLVVGVGRASAAMCGGSTICNCGDTITTDYTLGTNLSCSNAGNILTIGADNITVDLSGHTINGDNVNTIIGIYINDHTNVTIQNGTISNVTTSGTHFAGGSTGTVNNLACNSTGNQGFQNTGSVNVVYNNITASNNVDDGFSMHGGQVVINTATFTNNVDGINVICIADGYCPSGTLVVGNNINIIGNSRDIAVEQATSGNVSGNFSNLLIDKTGGNFSTYSVRADGANASLTLSNATIENIPVGTGSAVVWINGGSFIANGLTINGNIANSSVRAIAMDGSGGTLFLKNGYIAGIGSHIIDTVSSGRTATIEDSIFNGVANGKYALITRDGSYGNFYNNTIYDSNNDGRGIYTEGTGITIAKNNILVGLNIGINLFSGNGLTASNNDLYNNTTNFGGSGSQTAGITSNPFFINQTGAYSSSSDFHLLSTSSAIDAGTDVGLTTDYAGSPIYGTPDIGAYEYQPPHTMGTNEIDTTAGARVYGDGKFRDLSTTSGTTADLTITPASGSFATYTATETRPAWLDITPPTGEATLIWEEGHKKWTESSDTLGTTSTLHTIGDLTPDTYYNVKIDDSLATGNITGTDCTAGVCKSNGSGEITFTYTGGYSTHTFDIQEGDNTPPTVTSGTTPKFHTDTTQVTLSLTTDENSTCHYSTNQADSFATMTPFTTTGTTSHTTLITNLTPNAYSYYALCQDSNTNETSYTLTFEIAQKEDSQSIDSNLKINSSTHNIENKKIYSDQKKITLKGQDDNMTNGEIKIYKDSHKWKTIHLNSKGEWNKGITLSNNISTDFKLKYLDQFGTELDSDSFTVNVDTTKPTFTTPFPTTLPKNQEIKFTATDNQKISYYRIKILDEAGHILRNRKQTKDTYTIPKTIQPQASTIIVRAYDKAGNYTEQKSILTNTQPKTIATTKTEVQGVSDTKEETTNSETATPTQEEPVSKPSFEQPQPTKTGHWWNPWSW